MEEQEQRDPTMTPGKIIIDYFDAWLKAAKSENWLACDAVRGVLEEDFRKFPELLEQPPEGISTTDIEYWAPFAGWYDEKIMSAFMYNMVKNGKIRN